MRIILIRNLFILLFFIVPIAGCTTTAVTKNYDHYLGETTISSGKIAFPGIFNGVNMKFIKINNKYLVEVTANSSTGKRIKNGTKLVFMANNTQRFISTAKNSNIQCIAQTCISAGEFKFTKTDFFNMAKAKKISFRIYYTNDNTTELVFNSEQILALRNFVAEIK
jgi:hypothetical protein